MNIAAGGKCFKRCGKNAGEFFVFLQVFYILNIINTVALPADVFHLPLQVMEREIQVTADGSHTVAIPAMQVTYHSRHGAIQESMHVFIEAGLCAVLPAEKIHILEMGFGTGLNALLTLQYALKHRQAVYYTSFELYPLSMAEAAFLNYAQQLRAETEDETASLEQLFLLMHQAEWEKDIEIHPLFTIRKTQQSLLNLPLPGTTDTVPVYTGFQLIYYDAFAPAAQPELWTAELFSKLYATLTPAGMLVTYCSKGDVRRAMLAAGFMVDKIPGPPGKREMLRATRPL